MAAAVTGSSVNWSKRGVGLEPKILARLVECAEPEIAPALDVDGGEVHADRGVEQEVAQILDDAHVHRLRRFGGEVAQEAVGAAEGVEVAGAHEEGIPQRDFGGAGDIAVVVDALGVPRDDRVPEAEGGAGELDRDRRVDLGL